MVEREEEEVSNAAKNNNKDLTSGDSSYLDANSLFVSSPESSTS